MQAQNAFAGAAEEAGVPVSAPPPPPMQLDAGLPFVLTFCASIFLAWLWFYAVGFIIPDQVFRQYALPASYPYMVVHRATGNIAIQVYVGFWYLGLIGELLGALLLLHRARKVAWGLVTGAIFTGLALPLILWLMAELIDNAP